MVDLHSYLQIKRRELKERIEFKNRNKIELFWEKIQLIVFYVWIEIRSHEPHIYYNIYFKFEKFMLQICLNGSVICRTRELYERWE